MNWSSDHELMVVDGSKDGRRASLLLATCESIRCALTRLECWRRELICIRATSYGQPDWDRGIET